MIHMYNVQSDEHPREIDVLPVSICGPFVFPQRHSMVILSSPKPEAVPVIILIVILLLLLIVVFIL